MGRAPHTCSRLKCTYAGTPTRAGAPGKEVTPTPQTPAQTGRQDTDAIVSTRSRARVARRRRRLSHPIEQRADRQVS
jgi:hypothetical protein